MELLKNNDFIPSDPTTGLGGDTYAKDGFEISVVGREVIYEGKGERISVDFVHQLRNQWFKMKGEEIDFDLTLGITYDMQFVLQ